MQELSFFFYRTSTTYPQIHNSQGEKQSSLCSSSSSSIMDLFPFHPIQTQPWPWFYLYSIYRNNNTLLQHPNHVHWTETTDTHFFSVDLPGMRKEKIRVELKDSTYLVIRTENENQDDDESGSGDDRRRTNFMRKFRLPEMVDVGRITAEFEDDVLAVAVPRIDSPAAIRVRMVGFDPTDLGRDGTDNVVARAA